MTKTKGEMKPVCKKCVEVHGRDTNSAIQCPKCNKIVGCFWHRTGTTHIVNCKRS